MGNPPPPPPEPLIFMVYLIITMGFYLIIQRYWNHPAFKYNILDDIRPGNCSLFEGGIQNNMGSQNQLQSRTYSNTSNQNQRQSNSGGQQSQSSADNNKRHATSKQTAHASAGSQPPNDRQNQRRRSLSPIPIPESFNPGTDTKSQSASEALRKAKEKNGIGPNEKQSGSRLYVPDRNNPGKSCTIYKFINRTGAIFYIRKDNATRYKDMSKKGDQPPHFNVSKSKKKSDGNDLKDVKKTLDDYYQSEDQKQHHYFKEDDTQPEEHDDCKEWYE